jgi:hypothetical protein
MKNYFTLILHASIFSFISYWISPVIFAISLVLPLSILLLPLVVKFYKNEKLTKFVAFLNSESKLLTYIKWDYLNGPIYYWILSLIWVVCIVNLIKDLSMYGEIGFDLPLMFFSVMIVSLVMIYRGYIPDYWKL